MCLCIFPVRSYNHIVYESYNFILMHRRRRRTCTSFVREQIRECAQFISSGKDIKWKFVLYDVAVKFGKTKVYTRARDMQ